MTERALVVYATHLLTRGFETVSADRFTAGGEPTNALFAAIRALTRALAFKEPMVAIAVVDAAIDHELPAGLVAQQRRLPTILARHGLRVVPAPPEIATIDLVAAYTRAALDDGLDVVVVGSDKRLAQLVAEDVWWYDAYKDVRYTPELVRKRFEVGPAHVSEWLALVGDDDALSGVKGIGKKGATTLIDEYGSVRAALARAGEVAGRTGKVLRASRDDVARELDRARIDPGVPLPVPLAELAFAPPEHAELQALYAELELYELLSVEGEAELDVEICDREEAVTRLVAELSPSEPVALVALTEDPSPVRGALAGLGLAQGGRIAYLPLSGRGRTLAAIPRSLAEWLALRERPLVGHEIKGAVVALARRGIAVQGIVGDTACASHLREPSNWAPHDLEIISRRVLHRALPEEAAVRGVGKRTRPWSAVRVDRAAGHAGARARAVDSAWAQLGPATDREQLAEYLELSATLARMERRGIACSAESLARAGEDFERIAASLESRIFELAGQELNLGSTKQLGEVLFAKLGLPVVKRTKTGWSTATEALERIEHAHPIVPLVIRWRMLRRLMDSWVTALSSTIDADGRIRSTCSPERSFSGRLVNSSPDLGRVPGRTPEMERIRRAFAAPEGTVLLSVDYRQLGLYVLAHLTRDPALVEPLSRGADLHVITAAAVLELPTESIDADQRQLGKVINFATFAGQGASALALQLGVSAEEAKRLIARFDDHYAVTRAFQDEQLRLAQERGWVQTLSGRRWPIGALRSPDHTERAYAERLARRATHEGSVADVSRRGLLCADQALRAAGLEATPLLQVHDEVLFEVPLAELAAAADIAAEAMRGAYALIVPLRVGIEAGANWADLKPLT